MNTNTIEKQARLLRTHTVVFADRIDMFCAIRAMQGQTTKAIAAELGISVSKAQYRIKKAQDSMGTPENRVRFRGDYRNGTGQFAQYVRAVTQKRAAQIVKQVIAPKFAPLSANRA